LVRPEFQGHSMPLIIPRLLISTASRLSMNLIWVSTRPGLMTVMGKGHSLSLAMVATGASPRKTAVWEMQPTGLAVPHLAVPHFGGDLSWMGDSPMLSWLPGGRLRL
jgi:hypothetical protein